jgi:serine protease Do
MDLESKPASGKSSTMRTLLGTVAVVALVAGVVAGVTWAGGGRTALADFFGTTGATATAPAVSGEGQRVAMLPVEAPILATGPAFTGGTLNSMADLVDHVLPSVVSVKVSGVRARRPSVLDQMPGRRPPGGGGGGEVQGSGFIIDPSGYVVTNNHVVDEGNEIEVVVSETKTYKAKLVGRDEATDIALLKIQSDEKFPAVSFADDRKVRVGDWVLAVGNPFGLGGTVTAGIVSARGRDINSGPFTEYLQIDAAINRGNSGGPTFDMRGQVIGMNTAIFSPTGGSVGIGFAIPATTIKDVVESLRSSGTVRRGWLGVRIENVTEEIAESLGLPKDTKGAIVVSIVAGSPAEKAGFRESDIVIAVNGEKVESNRDMTKKVATLAENSTATFTVLRDGKTITLRATVGRRDEEERVSRMFDRDNDKDGGDSAKVADLGLQVAPINPMTERLFGFEPGSKGVVVMDVDPESDAAGKGLSQGDRIVGVNQESVSSIRELEAGISVAQKAGRSSVLLKVQDDRGRTRFVPVRIGKR